MKLISYIQSIELPDCPIELSKADLIATLAFTAMVKQRFTNSIVFDRTAYQFANMIGLSDGRIAKKYLKLAYQQGFFKISGNRMYFTPWMDCLKKLFPTKNYRKIRGFINKPFKDIPRTFKNFQYHIEKSLIGLNFQQQNFNITKNCASPNDQITETIPNRYGAKMGVTEQSLDIIKTGCNHLARIIGRRSATTANRRFKKLRQDKSIRYIDAVAFVPYEGFAWDKIDEIKAQSNGLVVGTESCIKVIYGKRILGYSLNRFKLKN